MQAFLFLAVFILLSTSDSVFTDFNHSVERVEEQTSASELVSLLNGTYFNLNENVCQLQMRVDALERGRNSAHQCECNKTEINDFKQAVSHELHAFSKILSGFENQMRLLQNEQTELRQLLGNDRNASSSTTSTTTTTTSTLEVCDEGWISSPTKCYYVSTTSEKTEWSIAVLLCTAKGAKLVEFETDEDARYIMGKLPSRVGRTDIIYIGRKRNDRDEWVFLSNNKPVDTSVRTWADDEPDGGSQRCGCTRQSEDFEMLDCYCTGYNLFYICELDPFAITTSTTTETSTTSKDCDQGWISSPEKCYYVSTFSINSGWDLAATLCSTKRAKLVEFQTDEEARYVMENLPSDISRRELFYTGRTMNNRDEWVFLSNKQPIDTSVRTWADREPDGRGAQRCGCTTQSFDFLMADCYCAGYDLFFICEIERNSS